MKSGWVTKKLGEVCESQIARLKSLDVENIKYIDISSIDRTTKRVLGATEYKVGEAPSRAQQVVNPDDLLVSTVRPNLNAVALVPRDIDGTMIASTGFSVLRPKDVTSSRWLYYYSQTNSFIDPLVADSEKAAYPSVTDTRVRELDIPVPPLPEQKRIVAKIDAAFEKIDKLKANAERNLANAKELFQTALDEAMRPKKGWVEKRLGEVCDGRLSYGTSAPSCPYNGKVRYIRITDIDDEGRLHDELVSPKTFERKHILVEGDIVLARTGATVGKSYLYSSSDGDCVYAGYLIRACVNRSMVLPEFAFYFTKTGSYWRYIHAEQAAAAQPNVNAEKYGNLLIPVPPLKEQREIVTMARVIHEKSLTLQQHYTQQIADCAEMHQSVLREAFEGRL